MSNLSLRLPDSLHRKVRQLARQDDISINQFIATAVAEKAAALLTVDYLEERGRRADPGMVDRILSRVPDVPPDPGDEWPRTPKRPQARRRPSKTHRTDRRKHGTGRRA
jgi:predicted transcriptional regulator